MDSTDRLVQALEEAGAPVDLVAAARADRYHEFRGPLPFPIRQLAFDLHRAGLQDLAARADAGDFDADNAEATAWLTSHLAQPPPRSFFSPRRRTGPRSAPGSAAG